MALPRSRPRRRKDELSFGKAFVSGTLAKTLVCLGVWMAWGARSATDTVLVIIPPFAAFVALNTEHSVANMSLIPLGWGVRDLAGSGFWEATGLTPAEYPDASLGGLVRNLVPVTLGNIVGGVLVGTAYRFAYLRPRERG